MTDLSPTFGERLGLAFGILFDGALAARVRDAARGVPALPPAAPPAEPSDPAALREAAARNREAGALLLLGALQREGRLVDFLRQSMDGFGDQDVGAAARVVHAGCRKALEGAFEVARVRAEEEGERVTVPAGFDGAEITLTGDVKGAPPYSGVLRHAGWRVTRANLPEPVGGHDVKVLAPAEVEL